MDLDKLMRGKQIQRQLAELRSYAENFPDIITWESVAEVLKDDFDEYKQKALDTLNYEIAALEAEFKEL